MPSAPRPDAHFRVEFDNATFAEDLEHTSADTGRTLDADRCALSVDWAPLSSVSRQEKAPRAMGRKVRERRGSNPRSAPNRDSGEEELRARPEVRRVVALTAGRRRCCSSGAAIRLASPETPPVTRRASVGRQTPPRSRRAAAARGTSTSLLGLGKPEPPPVARPPLHEAMQRPRNLRPASVLQYITACI
jgi:hypothetical protein